MSPRRLPAPPAVPGYLCNNGVPTFDPAGRAALFLALARWAASVRQESAIARWLDDPASAPVAYSQDVERGVNAKGADVCHHADAPKGSGRAIQRSVALSS